jgi:hypothetical protein
MAVNTQNTYTVSIPPRSLGSEMHLAIAALDDHHQVVYILAEGAQFYTPREICALRALLDHAGATSGRVVFHCPTNADVHRYLSRMDFYEGLPRNIQLTVPVPALRRRDRRGRLIEVVRIRTADDVEALMDRVWEVAKAKYGTGSVAKACATAIAAATENTLDHAQSPIGALVSAQTYTRSGGLELAVVDLGCGIPATLSGNPAHAGLSDLDALERALEDGVSSATEAGRGAGLAELVRGIGRVGTASLRIASGRAELNMGWQGGQERRNRTVPAYTVRGTWIAVRLEG